MVDLENKNAKVGLRKRKEVVIGGKIYYVNWYAHTDVNAIKFGVVVVDIFMLVICWTIKLNVDGRDTFDDP